MIVSYIQLVPTNVSSFHNQILILLMLTDTLTDGLDIRKMVDVSVRFMLPDNDIGHCWRLINGDCEARILNPIFA